jgi:hypothetical protein
MCCKQGRCSLPLSHNRRFKACTEFEAKLFAKQNPRNAVSRGRAETGEVAVCSIPRDAPLPQGVDGRFTSTRGSLRTPGAPKEKLGSLKTSRQDGTLVVVER